MNNDKNFKIKKSILNNIKWVDPLTDDTVQLYGFAFIYKDKVYNRLPLSRMEMIKNISPNLGELAKNTSGGQIHFRTNSRKILIDVILTNRVNLSGMTAIGQGGFDIYVGNNYDDMKFYDASRFSLTEEHYQYTFDLHSNGEEKIIIMNFPLYNGVKALRLGFDLNADIYPSSYTDKNRIAIYGTSITQGGCASRPGLSFTNILSRRLKREILNFGFSGNAFGEREIAEIIAAISNIDIFILDYEANAGTNGLLAKTLEDFIKIIREKNPLSKIFVLSRIKYLFDDLNPELGKAREVIRVFQEDIVKKLRALGEVDLHYINGSSLLGEDYHEYTIDGIHPNDLGFMEIAKGLENILMKYIKPLD